MSSLSLSLVPYMRGLLFTIENGLKGNLKKGDHCRPRWVQTC